jgi:hypothetical protein
MIRHCVAHTFSPVLASPHVEVVCVVSIRRCILYGNVDYIEIPSVNCCVSTASVCMYIHIIQCNICK